MVDLPQHAAQLAAWLHRNDTAYHPERFELNLRTPYLLAYLLARGLAQGLGVMIGLKLVIWGSIVSQVIALRVLCQRLGHDPGLALVGFPLAVGYNFLFGFVSYIAAVPLILLTVAFAYDHVQRPTLASGAKVIATSLTLLAAHGIAFAQLLALIGPMLLLSNISPLARVIPLTLPVLVAAIWLIPGAVSSRLGVDSWEPSLSRLLELPGLLLASGSRDVLATAFGVGLLLLVGLGLGRLERDPSRWVSGIVVAGSFLAFPEMFRGYGPLWPRFAFLLLPALLLAFRPAVGRCTVSRRFGYVGFTITWMAVFSWRHIEFNRETAPFHRMVGTLPSALRLRPIVFAPGSAAFPGLPALNHVLAYYYVEKGGIQGYSFAMYPASVVRFKRHVIPTMTGGAEWRPSEFSYDKEAADYDCFIVHAHSPQPASLFAGASHPPKETRREPPWYAYCHTGL